ncbi:sigma-54-dependent Fis family transcriptional regulator [Candidatus Sumerlaeota bacterium]|nr:sigma-54-dependent Fis family transcriptional regulator [Candidatus Sumerlaeota bacterium]
MSPKILIADDELNVRLTLREMLRREGYEIDEAVDGQQAVDKAQESVFDVIILDIKMPRLGGIEAMKQIRDKRPSSVCLIVTAYGSPKVAREAYELGAYDLFHKPFDIQELRTVVGRAVERAALARRVAELQTQLRSHSAYQNIIGESAAMKRVFEMIQRVADSDATVLITGESGTGKELIAEAIHALSQRRDQDLTKVNCAAIPDTLLESELFGHEKGAFTGAFQRKQGLFETASGGSIFLDEIGEIPLSLQPKLLRTLQEREISRVGSVQTIHVDLRVIAATNRNLQAEVNQGKFREDLFYRLNVISIEAPPLRERMEDLPLLVHHFLDHYSKAFNKDVRSIDPEAMDILVSYNWPGNIRQLQNAVQRGVVLTGEGVVQPQHLPSLPASLEPQTDESGDLSMSGFDFSQSMSDVIEEQTAKLEIKMILAALRKVEGRRQEAADLLGISRKSLHNKMLKYELFDEE